MELTTDRLILRPWRDDDRAAFARMNADPVVMQHFPSTLSQAESDSFADRIESRFEADGFGLFAVEVVVGEPFIGFVGLSRPSFESHFTPAVEIGWRLDRDLWGHGYATEAALRCVDYAFDDLDLDELVSFTVPANRRSRSVMERIGMTHDPADDFDHPRLPKNPELQRHVLYRLGRNSHMAQVEGSRTA